MSPEELEKLIREVSPVIKAIGTGEIAFSKDEYLSSLIILSKGEFLNEIVTPSGKSLSVNQVSAPNVIAASLLFLPPQTDTTPPYEAWMAIRAKRNSEIVMIKRKRFREALQRFPSLLDGFLEVSARRFLLVSKRLHYLALGDLRRKAAFYLLELPRKNNTVQIPMPYTELAAHFAVERPSLSAVLKKMEDTGLILREKNRTITLLDTEKLEELLY